MPAWACTSFSYSVNPYWLLAMLPTILTRQTMIQVRRAQVRAGAGVSISLPKLELQRCRAISKSRSRSRDRLHQCCLRNSTVCMFEIRMVNLYVDQAYVSPARGGMITMCPWNPCSLCTSLARAHASTTLCPPGHESSHHDHHLSV